MVDLFSLLPQAESVKLLAMHDAIFDFTPQPGHWLHRRAMDVWLAAEYAARREQQSWRKRDVAEYRSVMARMQPRLRS